jgi:hypothetical protein
VLLEFSFANTALENTAVAMTFGNGEKFNTGTMPDTQYLLEPRVGFNLMLLVILLHFFVEVVVYLQVAPGVFFI